MLKLLFFTVNNEAQQPADAQQPCTRWRFCKVNFLYIFFAFHTLRCNLTFWSHFRQFLYSKIALHVIFTWQVLSMSNSRKQQEELETKSTIVKHIHEASKMQLSCFSRIPIKQLAILKFLFPPWQHKASTTLLSFQHCFQQAIGTMKNLNSVDIVVFSQATIKQLRCLRKHLHIVEVASHKTQEATN